MGTQTTKKNITPDTRSIDTEIKRIQDLDALKLAMIGGYDLGYDTGGVNTISYVNVSSSLVSGTQTVDAGLPGPPQDLAPEVVSTTAINVFYKQAMANPVPTQYKSYRSLNYEFTSPIIATITYAAGAGGFSYSGLGANTRYYFKYSSINANGEGPTSDIVSAVTQGTGTLIIDTTPPGQVTGLIVTPFNASRLDLTWDSNPEPDLDHYNIYRGTTSGFSVILGTTPPLTSTITNSYSNTSLSASTTYYYKISAVDDAGNFGTLSTQASGTTAAPPKTADFLLHLDNSLADSAGGISATSFGNNNGFTASGSTPFGTHQWAVNYVTDLGGSGNVTGDFLDYNPAATSIRMDTTTGFSVSLWAYCTDTAALTSRRVLIEGKEDTNNMWSLQFDPPTGIVYFFVKKAGTDYKRQVGTLPLFGWHHIAAVFDGVANTVKLYFDAVEGASSAATTQFPTATGPILSIARRIGASAAQTRFRGFLDEIQYFKAYRLSAAEVTSLKNINTIS